MTKIVYNNCFGGFGLSDEALKALSKIKEVGKIYAREIERDDPDLVRLVEEMGYLVNSSYSDLQIVDLPIGTKYRIDEYDGSERVMQMSDYEWKTA